MGSTRRSGNGKAGSNGFDAPRNKDARTPHPGDDDASMLPEPHVEPGAAGPSVPIVSLPTIEPQFGEAANGADATPAAAPKKRVLYDCSKCPGYCCSYPVITVTKYDVTRLARYFSLAWEEAERKFTKSAHGYKRILRRKKDEHYGKICRFFDQENRRCGIYPARPAVCRSFPGDGHCGYYDFLKFERRTQGDPDFISLTDHG